MLDEVFGSLDEGRRTNVLALLEKLNQRFEQILVITHLDDIKEGVQSIIEIEYDDATGAVQVGGRADGASDLVI
jgi:exonuclease SbcC